MANPAGGFRLRKYLGLSGMVELPVELLESTQNTNVRMDGGEDGMPWSRAARWLQDAAPTTLRIRARDNAIHNMDYRDGL